MINVAKEKAKAAGKSKLRSIRVEKAQNGGFVMTHESDGPWEPGGDKKHVAKDGKAMIAHMKQHMCEPTADDGQGT